MSKRHQASRRRTYGRRQHEVRERRERTWGGGTGETDLGEEVFAPAEAVAPEHRALPYLAAWIGLE